MHGVTRWVAAGDAYLLKPGHLLAVAPRIQHHLAGPTRSSHHFYYAAIDFAAVFSRQPALAAGWDKAPTTVHRADATALSEPFAQLVAELTMHRNYPAEGLTLAVDRLILATTRLLTSAPAVPRLAIHPAVLAVKLLLDREYHQRWTLDQLANRAGLAPTYLAGLFAAQLGQPPHRYLNERRIDRAWQLLTGSDLSIAEVGISLGFSSGQHFARTFRQLAGCPPREYRRTAA
jgi:AraC-like DNA-binding protein